MTGEAPGRSRQPLPSNRRLRTLAPWALGTAAAFAAYLELARTRAVNSDGASNALQAWDMLHGNLLLHGWSLSDVSFYTTELPQYMLVELARGLNADVAHVAAAMTYTLAVLLAALLAKGGATGRQAIIRVLIAVGIMLAPQLDSGVNILISSPDHIGTSVPVMAAWLILDRAVSAPGGRPPGDPAVPSRGDPSPRTPLGRGSPPPRIPPRYIPPIIGALLGWAQVADTLVLYIGVLPLAAVCSFNIVRAVTVRRRPLAEQRYPIALAAAALIAAAAAMLALRLIHTSGGFYAPAPEAQLAHGATLLHNLGVAGQGLLLLGGADFLGLPLTAATAFTALHLAGVLLAAWGICLAAWRFPRAGQPGRDLVAQLLVAGVAVNLAVYVISTKAGVITQTREIAPVLPFSAALAGRTLAGRLQPARLIAPLLIVLIGYLAGLGLEISRPPVPAQDQQLTSWLEGRNLHAGLSGYWESNVVTLTSGDRIRIRTVGVSGGRIVPAERESQAQWYDPASSTATFVVLFPGVPGYPGFTPRRAVLATFGRPARTYRVGSYTVLVWDRNLLRELGGP